MTPAARAWWALPLVLAVAAGARADQTDPRLGPLFETLAGTHAQAEGAAAERAIWEIWIESGDEQIDRIMLEGVRSMAGGRLAEAIASFDRIVDAAPAFAEGWNKRATAYYLNGDLEASMADIRRTLALEPRHFGAISGMGLIFLARGDREGALEVFEEVLRIHPTSPAARLHVEALRRALQEQGIALHPRKDLKYPMIINEIKRITC